MLGEKRKIRDHTKCNFPIKMNILINNNHAIDVNTSGSDFDRPDHAKIVEMRIQRSLEQNIVVVLQIRPSFRGSRR